MKSANSEDVTTHEFVNRSCGPFVCKHGGKAYDLCSSNSLFIMGKI